MGKLKIIISLLAFSLFTFFLEAQSTQSVNMSDSRATGVNKYSSTDWVSMMRDRTVNIHDVQKAFYKWYDINHKEEKEKGKITSGEENDGAYEFFKRWEWFNLPRADANGNRPDLYKIGSEYQAYLNTSPTHSLTHTGSLHSSPPSSGAWTYAGNNAVPTNGGGDGRVNRVRIMPGNNNTMFACAPSGGLWKTTNAGASWATNTDQIGDLSTSDVAINPLKTNVMYLATGDADGIQAIYQTPATIGVLKSYNGGNTWVSTGLSETMSYAGANNYAVSELLIDPSDTSVLIAATTFGIWRSANSGLTWTNVLAGWFHSVEFAPGNSSIVYAGASSINNNAAFYRSADNGATWTQITSGLPLSGYAEGYEIAVTAANPNYVYVLADSTGTFGFEGLYRSTNQGVSFSTMSLFSDNGVPNVLGWSCTGNDVGGQGWYTLSMAVSQTNANDLWVGGVNIWSSANGGATWALNSDWTGGSCGGTPYVHADIHGIQFIPGTNGYIVGCDGGVFSTANGGTTWTDVSNNLEIAQQYCVGSEAATAGKWITGWQDNGTNFSNAPWKQIMGGDGMDCFISWANNNNMFAESGNGGLEYSTNGGTTWHNPNTYPGGNPPWVTVQVQDPKTATSIYAGFQDVFKSTDGGNNYTNQLSTWGGSNGGEITAIAVDSATPNYIYASQANMIQVTTNGGGSWTDITAGLPVVSTSISGIAVSSKKPSHVWVTMAGYSSGNQVFESINSGATWTNISTGLPNLPVNCIVSESSSPNGIYIGTDQGVYYHDTVINAWDFYNTGLPLVMIGDLTIYQPGKQLIAATFGRGTWQTPLYSTTAPVAYFDGVSRSVCAGSSVTFTDTSSNFPTAWNWTFTGGTPPTATTRTVSVVYTTPGTYAVSLTVTNSSGNSTINKPAYITVNANPTVTATTTTNVFCRGESTGKASSLPAGGAVPYTYLWAPSGGTLQTASNLSAGTYTVTLTDKNGCTATATATITQPLTGVNVSAGVTTNISCNGGNNGGVTATASSGVLPYTYAWSGGGTSAAKSGLTAGTYTISVTDNSGCSTSTTVIINQPLALAVTTDSINVNSTGPCNGLAAVTVSGGTAPYNYSWSPGGATTDTINGQCAGIYCCTITDKNGCSTTSCVIIANVTGIPNISNSSNINIYPDPNSGSFTLSGVIKGQVVELYNDLGQKLSSLVADNTSMYFDISTRADGIYLVRILSKDGSLVTQKKIVKAHQ